VLLEFAENSDMQNVWSTAEGEAVLSFAITDLVAPEDFESSYYHYWGSLTTPPCTPAVSWHLARNTIKVRGSTMDTFREKTTQWTTASGAVDANLNFRPIQSNPSCVSTCYADESENEWCPDIDVSTSESDDGEGGSSTSEEGLDAISGAIWLVLVLLFAMLTVVFATLWCRTRASKIESNLASNIEKKEGGGVKEPLSPKKDNTEIEMQSAAPYATAVGAPSTTA